MNIKDVKKLNPLERLLYWIKERESIRLKKEAGKPKPWTDDEILQSYRFCNVRRMDDKVSQWILHNWYEPYRGHHNMLLAVAMARLFNQPHTLAHIGFPVDFNPTQLIKRLQSFSKSSTVFNAAYIVSTNGRTMNKIEYVIRKILTPLAMYKLKSTDLMKDEWERLMEFNGLASFMAGQIVADLRHAVDGKWQDKNSWAAMGPGSKRGMNRLCELDKNTAIRELDFQAQLTDLIGVCQARLPKEVTRRLEAIDFQNCLCEFDKYERTLFDGRRPKRCYEGSR